MQSMIAFSLLIFIIRNGDFMNILVTLLFVLGLIALFHKVFHLNEQLAAYFDQGMASMGSLLVSIAGWYVVLIPLINNHQDFIFDLFKNIPFDPTIFIGCSLSNVLGGYHIVEAYSQQSSMIIFSGVMLASTIGAFFSFQLPIFLNGIKDNLDTLMYGFVVGLITLPITLITIAIYLKIELIHLIPIIFLCMILLLGIIFKQHLTLKIMNLFARFIQLITYLLFMILIIRFFLCFSEFEMQLLKEACMIVLKMTISIIGSFVLADFLIKHCTSFLKKLAILLHVDLNSIIGLLLSLSSSVSMLPYYSKMNETGKKMNAAFSISGAYLLGGQLAFVNSVCPQYSIYFLITKLCAGLIAILTVYFLSYRKVK